VQDWDSHAKLSYRPTHHLALAAGRSASAATPFSWSQRLSATTALTHRTLAATTAEHGEKRKILACDYCGTVGVPTYSTVASASAATLGPMAPSSPLHAASTPAHGEEDNGRPRAALDWVGSLGGWAGGRRRGHTHEEESSARAAVAAGRRCQGGPRWPAATAVEFLGC
jgi:hypothetical protein